MALSTQIWQRLRGVVALSFVSRSRSGIGWGGLGSGVVAVSEPEDGVLLFEESGWWQQEGGGAMRFTNTFRWSQVEKGLRLEHLRFGAENPVFLFDMEAGEGGTWHEVSPHPCRDDCYRASLRLVGEQLFVKWLVHGPKRDEIIEYIYV